MTQTTATAPAETTAPERRVAWNREESDRCQRGTPGCSIDQDAEARDDSCEPW